jgi:FHS family L-fucose permease-like MFS transporter
MEDSVKGRFILKGSLFPFILVTSLFFMWGIPNNLNDVLIKQFMKSFEISRFQAGLVQSAFYMGYFTLAIPAALLMRKYNYKTGLALGLILYSIGCFLFLPAAIVGKYGLFLLALFVIASGLAFLETGANPFIANLGDPKSSERRLNFSQAFNPVGSIVGVLIGTIFIFSGIEHNEEKISAMKATGEYSLYLKHETMRVVTPYLVLAGIALLWAIMIIKTKFPVIDGEHEVHSPQSTDERLEPSVQIPHKAETKGSYRELFKYPHYLRGIVAQFFYVGAQVGTWSYFIQYVQDYTNQPEKVAGYFLTGTLAAFLIGRFSATIFMHYIKPNRLMGIYGAINVLLVLIAVIHPGWIGVWSIFLTSFFMSLMYPTIFAMSIKGLGHNTKIGGSLIVMAIIGGAVLTPIMGLISMNTHSMALAMTVPLLAYVFISYYAWWGCNPGGMSYKSN